jgi:hypothetical protein
MKWCHTECSGANFTCLHANKVIRNINAMCFSIQNPTEFHRRTIVLFIAVFHIRYHNFQQTKVVYLEHFYISQNRAQWLDLQIDILKLRFILSDN